MCRGVASAQLGDLVNQSGFYAKDAILANIRIEFKSGEPSQ
jgi:hypothetical protein